MIIANPHLCQEIKRNNVRLQGKDSSTVNCTSFSGYTRQVIHDLPFYALRSPAEKNNMAYDRLMAEGIVQRRSKSCCSVVYRDMLWGGLGRPVQAGGRNTAYNDKRQYYLFKMQDIFTVRPIWSYKQTDFLQKGVTDDLCPPLGMYQLILERKKRVSLPIPTISYT